MYEERGKEKQEQININQFNDAEISTLAEIVLDNVDRSEFEHYQFNSIDVLERATLFVLGYRFLLNVLHRVEIQNIRAKLQQAIDSSFQDYAKVSNYLYRLKTSHFNRTIIQRKLLAILDTEDSINLMNLLSVLTKRKTLIEMSRLRAINLEGDSGREFKKVFNAPEFPVGMDVTDLPENYNEVLAGPPAVQKPSDQKEGEESKSPTESSPDPSDSGEESQDSEGEASDGDDSPSPESQEASESPQEAPETPQEPKTIFIPLPDYMRQRVEPEPPEDQEEDSPERLEDSSPEEQGASQEEQEATQEAPEATPEAQEAPPEPQEPEPDTQDTPPEQEQTVEPYPDENQERGESPFPQDTEEDYNPKPGNLPRKFELPNPDQEVSFSALSPTPADPMAVKYSKPSLDTQKSSSLKPHAKKTSRPKKRKKRKPKKKPEPEPLPKDTNLITGSTKNITRGYADYTVV